MGSLFLATVSSMIQWAYDMGNTVFSVFTSPIIFGYNFFEVVILMLPSFLLGFAAFKAALKLL